MKNAVEIKNLTKTYGKHRGVSDISLNIGSGDFFGFIGPNGAGKSTTIRSMLGLIHYSAGSISILDMDAKINKVSILKKVGYMPSETMFYPDMRASQIIEMSAEAYHMDCTARAKELCERLKLDTNKKIGEFSLGNRKKISIVCTLQHSPELYILDEPTSGLDPLIQKEFFELLAEENEKGKTIFFSSHVLSEVQHYCNRAAIIKEGRLIASDTVENLSKTSARRVKLRGTDKIPDIPGILVPEHEAGSISFMYSGKPKDLLRSLSGLELTDIIIEEPSLEEIFLHFYEEAGNASKAS